MEGCKAGGDYLVQNTKREVWSVRGGWVLICLKIDRFKSLKGSGVGS